MAKRSRVLLLLGSYTEGEQPMSVGLDLETMSVAEKLAALEAIWADLCNKPCDVISPEWHEEVLADRAARLKSGEATESDWSEAKKRLQDLGQ